MLGRLIKAPAVLSVVWPALLVAGGYLAWHQWGADHVAEKYCCLLPERITVTPPPPFVQDDLVETIYRDTAMEGLSLLEPHATAKIASAFSMSPWVRRVVTVQKLPGGLIDVRLQYRRPVAMVLVAKESEPGNFFLPVDGEGVLLPTWDRAPEVTRQFIHIEVPGLFATGRTLGAPFGDARVESAAKLAELLADHRVASGVASIRVPGDPRTEAIPMLEVTTRSVSDDGVTSERTWLWGNPIGREAVGEPTAAAKLQALQNPGPTQPSDLRMASGPAAIGDVPAASAMPTRELR